MVAHCVIEAEHDLCFGENLHEHPLAASTEMGAHAVGEYQSHSSQLDSHDPNILGRITVPGLMQRNGCNRKRHCLITRFLIPIVVGRLDHALLPKEGLQSLATALELILKFLKFQSCHNF